MKKPQLSKQPKTSKAVELEIPRPSMAKLSTTVEPHARYQEIIKELAQARLDKKKKLEDNYLSDNITRRSINN